MKILGFDQYNEKLKINPINLDDFDKINTSYVFDSSKYKKEDLKTGDLCMIKIKEIGVVILKHTIDLKIYGLSSWNSSSVIMFPEVTGNWSVLLFSDFNDRFEDVNCDFQYNILKIAPAVVDFNTLENEKLLKLKFETEYKNIFNI